MRRIRDWLTRRVVEPLIAQVKRGLTAEGLAAGVTVSLAIAINPVIGTTTVLCLLAGRLFRLNHVVMQTVNHLTYPLQILLLVPFVRLGEWLTGAEPLPLSPSLLIEEFKQSSFWGFVAKFGLAYAHGLLGWVIVVPLASVGLYFALVPLFRRLCPPAPPSTP
jgi:uncharacterized protein (DUF2062 family)